MALIDIATAFLHFLELEGKTLKIALMNVGWALAFFGFAFILILTAAGFSLGGRIAPCVVPGFCTCTDFRERRKLEDRCWPAMRCASVREWSHLMQEAIGHLDGQLIVYYEWPNEV